MGNIPVLKVPRLEMVISDVDDSLEAFHLQLCEIGQIQGVLRDILGQLILSKAHKKTI